MARKPNVLLVVPRLNIGGAETYVATLARSLKERGYHVTAASWGGQWAKRLAQEGIPHYLVPIRFNPALAGLMLERIIKKQKIDLIHANACDGGRAAFPVCKRLNLPWVLTAHGAFGQEKRNQVLKHAHKIICVSKFLQKHLEDKAGIEKDKLVTIYNGINLKEFSYQTIPNSLRKQWGLTEADFVIGIVSRIWELNTKGHDDLFQVLANYPEAKDWKLLVVGKGKALPALKSRVRQLGIAKQVVFAGFRTDIPEVLAAMDILALPSGFETFGLAAAEAMAMGKPVVAYDIGGIPEVVGDGKTGFLVPKNNVQALAERIKELYSNQQKAQEMGLLGRQMVEGLFDNEQMVDRVTALYEEVLAEQGRTGE